MTVPPIRPPDSETLARQLSEVLSGSTSPATQITILAREPNPHTSTYLSEILTCRLVDGNARRLLCKYMGKREHNAFGHRGGVSYEAKVYRRILQQLAMSTPAFYGSQVDARTEQGWLLLEYFDGSRQLDDSHDRTLMQAAARWLAEFHRTSESLLTTDGMPFLKCHDADYYLGWAERTARFANYLHRRFPWLATLCRRFVDVIPILLKPPTSIVHGEYYPTNILSLQGSIYPIDWESTALAAAEIDLSSLIEGWPAETARSCISTYQAVRWPAGPPADFRRRLEAVQLYWHLRWLGDRWTHQTKALERFDGLYVLGKKIGLI